MFSKSYKIIIIFILFFLGFYLSASAYKLEKYDDKIEDKMVVTPSKLELNLQAGQKIEKEILLINRLGRREEFFIQAEGLVNKEDFKNSTKKNFPNSSVDWINPEINSIFLEHGERVKFNIEINVPEDVGSGGYYAAINISMNSEKDSSGSNQINLKSRIGIPLLISIPGNVQRRGEISNFSVDKWFYLNGPVKFFSDFKNLGNIHLMPNGEISVYNFLGSKVAQISLKDSTVLPSFTQNWESIWKKKWLLGKYRAELSMYFGDSKNEILKKEITFWAFPFHLLLLLILIIILIYFIIKKVNSKFEIKIKDDSQDDSSF